MEAEDPEGLANLEPGGMIGMLYVGDHQALLYTKYISCGPYGYGIEDYFFLSFSNYESMPAIDPHVHVKFSAKGLDWQVLCRGTTRHTKYISYNLVVSEKIVLCLSHYQSMGVIDAQDVAKLYSRGLIGRIYVVEH